MSKQKRVLGFREHQYTTAIVKVKDLNIPQLENVLASYENDLELEDFSNDLLQRFYKEGVEPFLTEYRNNIDNQIKGFAQVIKTQILNDVDQKINSFRAVWNDLQQLNVNINSTYGLTIINTCNAFNFDADTKTFYLSDEYVNGYLKEFYTIYALPEDERFIKAFDEIYNTIEKHLDIIKEVGILKNVVPFDEMELLKVYRKRSNMAGISVPAVRRSYKRL